VQVILLAWFLENFLEGTAGFGTPSTVVAPLLVGIGFTPLTAVAVSLLGNSTSVLFGAAGTPIRIGMAGLPTAGVAQVAAGLNMIGAMVPTFMLIAITAGQKQRWQQVREGLPFAIVAGLAFVIPAWLSTWVGEEFPSILGAIIGLFFMILMIRRGWFQPRRLRTLKSSVSRPKTVHMGKVWLPYGLLVLLLVIGKFAIGSAGITLHFGLIHTIAFFNPGWAFFIAAIPVLILWRSREHHILASLGDSFRRSLEPFLVIAFMSTMAQLMIHSAVNSQHLPSLLSVAAHPLTSPWLPLWAPFIGAFGNFLTGSATVSNIMFGTFIYQAGTFMKMNGTFILALELVGAAAGNMIALADILPAQAVVGLRHQERGVLRRVIVPCLLYVGLAGVIGLAAFQLKLV
jgi:lactate permease